jgi:nucleoside 2-deoxyribosyltransferase
MTIPDPIPQTRPRIYLAGPDVFLPDPIAFGAKKKQVCERYGLEGVFPFDAEVEPRNQPRRETAFKISEANENLIRGCVGVIANMTPFRGISADVGTAFEMGFKRRHPVHRADKGRTRVGCPAGQRGNPARRPGHGD